MSTAGIKLDDRTQRRLKKLGTLKDRSPHWLMKEAIARYLDIEERIERERLEDKARYDRFVATGEHIPHEQMMVWLEGLGASDSRASQQRPRKAKTRKRASKKK